ncbi:phosphonate C-P lyase system protein PhnH [Thioclava sp.]|uniref:phosphonate C-P lyase system protein PhnH n=1 Tax=Thioclava sp. TaxID=1933450 RepID=UPI003AA7D7C2
MQSDLSGGFAQAPQQAAQAFRACLEAMARPGQMQAITGAAPPAPLSPAAGAVLLTLVDQAVTLHLARSHDTPAIRNWVAFHCGAPLVSTERADFALGTWAALDPIERFAIGTPDYPDRSATLIVENAEFGPVNARLSGPGIAVTTPAPLPAIEAFAQNHAQFPLGVDFLLCSGAQVFGLPRSTEVEAL